MPAAPRPTRTRNPRTAFRDSRLQPPSTDREKAQAALEPLLSPQQLADFVGVSLASVYTWNHLGTAPRRLSLGRIVRYRVRDVEEWLQANEAKGC